jgi:hypothetical protein
VNSGAAEGWGRSFALIASRKKKNFIESRKRGMSYIQ